MDAASSKLVSFTLNGIKTEQFALLDGQFDANTPLQVITELQYSIEPNSRLVISSSEFQLKQRDITLIKLKVLCFFNIAADNWVEFITEDGSQLTLPKNLLAHLATITIGTARGILHAKTEGTPYHAVLLPLVNVVDMVTSNAVFHLETK